MSDLKKFLDENGRLINLPDTASRVRDVVSTCDETYARDALHTAIHEKRSPYQIFRIYCRYSKLRREREHRELGITEFAEDNKVRYD